MPHHVSTAVTSRNLSVFQNCFNIHRDDASDIANALSVHFRSIGNVRSTTMKVAESVL